MKRGIVSSSHALGSRNADSSLASGRRYVQLGLLPKNVHGYSLFKLSVVCSFRKCVNVPYQWCVHVDIRFISLQKN